jgi:hypothetical protein
VSAVWRILQITEIGSLEQMKRRSNVLIFHICIVIIVLIVSATFGCGGGSSSNGHDNGNDPTNDEGNEDESESSRLVCEEIFSEDFIADHSLTIETHNITENPTEGAEQACAFCAIKRDGNRVSSVNMVNANKETYDSLLEDLTLENNMVEDNSVGMNSAYTYYSDGSELLYFIFLGSNNATTVTIIHIDQISLEETIEIAQEIDSNLPYVEPLENTAPDYQCQEMISESDLISIFDQELFYESNEPSYRSNYLECSYATPESVGISEMLYGNIGLYCDPPPEQITPQQKFQITEDMILEGYTDVPNTRIIFEDVQELSEIGSRAYFYTMAQHSDYGPIELGHKVIFLHNSRNCVVELGVSDFSDQDISQQLIEVARRVDGNL